MLTWPSPAMATLPLRRTETMVVPRNCSIVVPLKRASVFAGFAVFFCAPADVCGRISGPDAGNQGEYRPGWSKCWRAPAIPARRADRGWIPADGLRTSAGTGADRHWHRYPGTFRPVFHPGLHRPRADAPAAIADKQRRLVTFARFARAIFHCRNARQRHTADRHDAVLVAFAGDPHDRVLKSTSPRFRSTSSDKRRPDEYSNSRIARSRSTMGPSPGIASSLPCGQHRDCREAACGPSVPTRQ